MVMLFLQATNGYQTHAYDTFSAHHGKGDPAPLGRKFAGEHTRRTNHRTLQKVCTPSSPLQQLYYTLSYSVSQSSQSPLSSPINVLRRRRRDAPLLRFYSHTHTLCCSCTNCTSCTACTACTSVVVWWLTKKHQMTYHNHLHHHVSCS